MKTLEVLFTPADFGMLQRRNLDDATCVVFDVLRATSSMITALSNGAQAIVPVAEIGQALEMRRKNPAVLLAGERDGVRIRSELTGGVDFDLGNSPREFTRARVHGKTIAMTTTNGTRALRACAHARQVLVGGFLNLNATAEFAAQKGADHLVLICSGTFDEAAYEDVLAAGAVCDAIWALFGAGTYSDAALMARTLFQSARSHLSASVMASRNARRLLTIPELKEDVLFCLQENVFSFTAALRGDGSVGIL